MKPTEGIVRTVYARGKPQEIRGPDMGKQTEVLAENTPATQINPKTGQEVARGVLPKGLAHRVVSHGGKQGKLIEARGRLYRV